MGTLSLSAPNRSEGLRAVTWGRFRFFGFGALACVGVVAGCVSPSRARYLGGGYTSLEDSAAIDNACRQRVANTAIQPRERVEMPQPQSQPETLTIDGGPLGRLRVVVRAPLASVPLAQLEVPPPQPVRGFLFGVDLRPYKRIAFVIDSGGAMCTPEQPNAPLPLDRATDQLVAAISGLPAETSFVLLGTASGVRELAPGPGDNGRRAAMQWTCNLVCSGDTSLAMALLDAFAEAPEIVVVLATDGAAPRADPSRDLDLQLYAADPELVVDHSVPIIAIDLGRAASPHLAAIAAKTGGIVVRP